ncbi:MAG: O-antigen ligase family protein [Verrucomicrobiota bacterium]
MLIIFGVVLLVAQFAVPSRYAFVPLLIAACQLPNVPVIQVGVSFSIYKIVISAGFLRALCERRTMRSARHPLDGLLVVWAGWMVLSGLVHNPVDHNPMTIRLSVIYDFVGSYFYARWFLRDRDAYTRYCQCLAVVLLPLAFLVLVEKITRQDPYGLVGGGMLFSEIREDRVRAAGPFGHAILLGSFASTSVPQLAALWRPHFRFALAGIAACLLIVICSASTGPIGTLIAGLSALALWRWRTRISRIRALVISGIIGLQLVMNAPFWYLMARVDLAGGSTGWHRAELISTAFRHLDEWWLIGTDNTRHWLDYGVGWSQHHIDITNHYLQLGVTGGLPLMLCFIAILYKAFQSLGRGMRSLRRKSDPDEYVLWCAGASLFAHAFTFISIAYFDQNIIVFGLLLGAVPGLSAVMPTTGRLKGPRQRKNVQDGNQLCTAPVKEPALVGSEGHGFLMQFQP